MLYIYGEKHWNSNDVYRKNLRILKRLNLNRDSIVIDAGFHCGEELHYFNNIGSITHAFEINRFHCENISEIYKDNERINIYQKAVWIEYCNIDAYEKIGNPHASMSVISDKHNIDKNISYKVEAIDLSDFILKLNSRVNLVKMDIEGAEYHVIEKLIYSGAIDMIDLVLFEDHRGKISKKTSPAWHSKRKEVKAKIKKLKLHEKFGDWR